MDRVGCTLIGTGAWGRLVAAEITHVAGLDLIGIADQDPARARAVADALTVEAFAAVDDALADERVQAVAIAVPNDRHADVAQAAISAGKHVLLEKPMALTVQDADAITAAALGRGVVLMLNHIQRYYAPLVEVKRLVAAGLLGDVQAASVSRRDFLTRTTPWLQQRRRVGGLLYQSACHEYDFLRWLCGDVVSIACQAAPRIIAHDTLDYPDVIVSQLRFTSGAIAQVWNCMTDPLMGYDGVVTGTEGSAWFDLYDGRVRWRRLGGEVEERAWTPPDRWAPWAWIAGGGIAAGEAEALRALLEDFQRAVSGTVAPTVTGEDGARVVELAQAGYLSIAENRPVALPLSAGDRGRATYLDGPLVG